MDFVGFLERYFGRRIVSVGTSVVGTVDMVDFLSGFGRPERLYSQCWYRCRCCELLHESLE